MVTVSVQEAAADLRAVLDQVLQGEDVLIAESGRAVARITPVGQLPPRLPGSAKGEVKMAPDFDAPLPDDMMEAFEP